jgi:hypothetical protein
MDIGQPHPAERRRAQLGCDTADGTTITRSWRFHVATMVLYLHPAGSDSAAGTRTAPLTGLQAAQNKLSTIASTTGVATWHGTLLLAGGTYNTDTTITIGSSLTVEGGYNPADWNVRSTSGYQTLVADSRTDGQYYTAGNPIITVLLNNVTNTILEGLTIRNAQITTHSVGGADKSASVAVRVYSGSPVIRLCTFTGNNSQASFGNISSTAIQLTSGTTATVSYCTINPGYLKNGSTLYGMEINTSASPLISNVTVNNGTATDSGSSVFGVMISSSTPSLANCTINGGTATLMSTGILLASTPASPVLSISSSLSGEEAAVTAEEFIFPATTQNPKFTDCTIDAGSGTSSCTAVYLDNNAFPEFYKCSISAKSATSNPYGILISNAAVKIHSSKIDVSCAAILSIGIYILSSNSAVSNIYNNIIHGGSSNSTTGIFLDGAARFYIRNNIINGGSGINDRTAITVKSVADGQSAIQNNLIFCDIAANSTAIAEIATVTILTVSVITVFSTVPLNILMILRICILIFLTSIFLEISVTMVETSMKKSTLNSIPLMVSVLLASI